MPAGIVAGPNGHMWYVLRSGATAAIGEIDDQGITVVHAVPDAVAQIHSAVLGPDDAVWFTMTVGGTFPPTIDTTPSLEGGVGVVFEALELQSRSRVALKMLRPEMLEFPEIVARFEREARAASRLNGRNAVRVRDVDTTDDGIPFIEGPGIHAER